MARTRRRRQSHAERVANYLRKHPGATRQAARGHGAHLRPPGFTEASYRRRREETRVLREGGTTSRERASMKTWFRRLATETSRAAVARGREPVTPGEFEFAWAQFIRAWGDRTAANFDRFKTTAIAWRERAYQRLRYEELGSSEAVEDEWIDDMDDEYGLMLSDTLWFILWRSGKPPDKTLREAAA